jgi:hypothetical protein
MNMDASKLLLLASLGVTTYITVSCPCDQVGYCKREIFFIGAAIPFGFAVYNFMKDETCPLK